MKINNSDNLLNSNIKSIFIRNVEYRVPYYQRNYSWENEQIEKILIDIFFFEDNDDFKQNHFLGIIISNELHQSQSHIKKYEVIDGQQRVATITLIAKALFEIQKQEFLSEIPSHYGENLKSILFNNEEGFSKLKLQLENDKQDNEVFDDILNDNEITNTDNLLNTAYNYICSKLNNKINNNKDLYIKLVDNFLNIQVINLVLSEQDDNPQSVFESLNSKGLPLTNADKIKNFIFMRISDFDTQEEYYKNYWKPIETFLDQKPLQIQNLFRDIVTLKTNKAIQKPKETLYDYFVKSFKEILKSSNIKNTLDNIKSEARLFFICTKNYDHSKIEKSENFDNYKKINNIVSKTFGYNGNDLSSVIFVYFAKLFMIHRISLSEFQDIIQILDIYIIRFTFQVNRGHLHQHLVKIMNYINFIKSDSRISIKNELKKFIKSDSETIKKCQDNNIPVLEGKGKYIENSIIESLFISSQNEKLNKHIVKIIESGESKVSDFNLEHVRPKDDINWDYDSMHNIIVKKIGNLAYIEKSLNQEAENKSFSNKQEIFKKSKSETIKFFLNSPSWSRDDIDRITKEYFDKYFDKYFSL